MKNRRVTANPLVGLAKLNAETDVRVERRVLTDNQKRVLVSATMRAQTRFGMSGPHRALTYAFALSTALRAKEINSLTWRDFDLDSDTPSVTVEAAYAKNGRRDTVPLKNSLVASLRRWKEAYAGPGRVFPLPGRPSEMIKEDLQHAGIPYKDSQNRVADFHSLRHTAITDLAKKHIPPKIIQAIARHRSIVTTLDRYAHADAQAKRDAVEVLPDYLEGTAFSLDELSLNHEKKGSRDEGGWTEELTDQDSSVVPESALSRIQAAESDDNSASRKASQNAPSSAHMHSNATMNKDGPTRIRTWDTRIMSPLL